MTAAVRTSDEVDTVIEEYRFLASFGTSHERIAARLGYTPAGLDTLVRRAGLTPKPWGPDADCARVLDQLIASGKEFTSSSIPLGSTSATVSRMLVNAHRAGRIRKLGTNSAGFALWQGVTE